MLVPVNPITALRNLIELPKLNFECQEEPTKLFTISTTFSGHHYRASDPSDFDGAKLKLASQILHSYILNHHAFSNVNVSHHARIIEAKNGSLYIVGRERNVSEPADGNRYSLYELKSSGITTGVTSKLNSDGVLDYLATGINAILLHYSFIKLLIYLQ